MSVKLLTEHNLECLSLRGHCTGSPESTLVKMPHCWKSHVKAVQIAAIAIPCGIQMKIHMFYFSLAYNFKQNSSLKN